MIIVGIVVNKFIVVVMSVFVIFGVIICNVVCLILFNVINVFMIFYIVLNRLIYGLIEFIVVKNERFDFSFFILWDKVMCIEWCVFFIIIFVFWIEFFLWWVNFLKFVMKSVLILEVFLGWVDILLYSLFKLMFD